MWAIDYDTPAHHLMVILIFEPLQDRLPSCGDFHLLRCGALVSDGGGDYKGGFAAACAESINAIIFTRLWPSVLKVRSTCKNLKCLLGIEGLICLCRSCPA